MTRISIPKGTKDVLPSASHDWQYLESVLRGCAADFGFSEIRFPAFEHTELFLRGVGDTTDIVQKEMYTFEDKGGRSITLRPEGTASVVRSVIENGLYAGTLPLKVYYIAPVFRYEKPQAGRLREHHQFGVEMFGAAGAAADAEVIALADTFLRRLGIESLTVSINSIGCPVCRKRYHEALREYFGAYKNELCPLCLDRMERNPLRLLDCKEQHCGEIAANAPVTLDYLCDECHTHFEDLKRELDLLGITYKIDPRIVRGLDYYTKTVFEFVATNIGAQSTVCGGGRYDRLVEQLGGPALPGLGFGCGLERLLMVLAESGIALPSAPTPDVFVAAMGSSAAEKTAQLVTALRRAGFAAERDVTGRSLKAQMKYADKLGANFSLTIGDNELAENTATLKNMCTGEASPVALTAEAIGAVLSAR